MKSFFLYRAQPTFSAVYVLLVLIIFFAGVEFLKAKKEQECAEKGKQEASLSVTISDPLWMAVHELRSYPGFESMSDAEATEYIYTMQQFCILTFELYQQDKSIPNE